jgi:hypothetical protein
VVGAAATVDELLTVTARHGLIPAEIRLADGTHLLLAPKDAPLPIEDPKAPKEFPDEFDDLPVPDGLPPNWKDPRDGRDTEDNRKRSEAEQAQADRLVFGEAIPTEEEATGGDTNPPTQ